MQIGSYSANDLRLLINFLPMFEELGMEVKENLGKKPLSFMTDDVGSIGWCHLYEMPFLDHLNQCIVETGLLDEVNGIARAANHAEAVAASIASFDAELHEVFSKASNEEMGLIREDLPHFYAHVTAIHNTLRSLLIYGVYLNDLIAQARGGDDRALFNAVRIDPTVVGCPSVISRISRAVLQGDDDFMSDLKRAMHGNIGKRENEDAQKRRYVLQVLFEAGALNLSDDALYELFVNELKIYEAPTEDGDPARNLRQFAYRFIKGKSST